MTVRTFVAAAALLGSLWIVGCGDAKKLCDDCEISDQRELCESVYNDCTAGDCEARALAACADPI